MSCPRDCYGIANGCHVFIIINAVGNDEQIRACPHILVEGVPTANHLTSGLTNHRPTMLLHSAEGPTSVREKKVEEKRLHVPRHGVKVKCPWFIMPSNHRLNPMTEFKYEYLHRHTYIYIYRMRRCMQIY